MNRKTSNNALTLVRLFGTLTCAWVLFFIAAGCSSPDQRAEQSPRNINTAATEQSTSFDSDVIDDAQAGSLIKLIEPGAKPEPAVKKPAPLEKIESLQPSAVDAVSPRASAEEAGEPFLEVIGSAMGTDVEGKNLQGAGTVFTDDHHRIWAWVKVKNRVEASHIVMVWKFEGVEKWRGTLNIGKSRGWRTWSRRQMRSRDIGHWSVEILDAQERLIHTLPFEIIAAPEVEAEAEDDDLEEGC